MGVSGGHVFLQSDVQSNIDVNYEEGQSHTFKRKHIPPFWGRKKGILKFLKEKS